ncbi:MAG TPA: hypothetical protein DGD08_01735, partial [Gemmatimonas aurantiaca]|nr:hypothetical protein [Gemmatimonas aurantiaca]
AGPTGAGTTGTHGGAETGRRYPCFPVGPAPVSPAPVPPAPVPPASVVPAPVVPPKKRRGQALQRLPASVLLLTNRGSVQSPSTS